MPTHTVKATIPAQAKTKRQKRSAPAAAAAQRKTDKQPLGATKKEDCTLNKTRIQRPALVMRKENEESKRIFLKAVTTNSTVSKKLDNPRTCSVCTIATAQPPRASSHHQSSILTIVEGKTLLPDLVTDVIQVTRVKSAAPNMVLSLPVTPKMPDCYYDPDSGSEQDPQLCVEYAKDIYNHLLQIERKDVYQIDAGYLVSRQFTVKPLHRSILVDWLIQVQQRFHLLTETMYLCVDILDRVIQVEPTIPKRKLQLVGVTALFIASKFEEIYPPQLSELVYLTDGTYTVNEVLANEIYILQKLDYQLNRPFPLHFLRRYSTIMGTTTKIHQLAKYILELSMLDHLCSSLLPSKRAAAALLLAAGLLAPSKSPFGLWKQSMGYTTKYKCTDFDEEKLKLKKALRDGHGSPRMTAIRKKYRDSVLSSSSTLTALTRL